MNKNLRDKFTIDNEGVIRYIDRCNPNFTALELHMYLQDLADDLPTKGSVIDITTHNPSVRYTNCFIGLHKPYRLSKDTQQRLIGHLVLI